MFQVTYTVRADGLESEGGIYCQSRSGAEVAAELFRLQGAWDIEIKPVEGEHGWAMARLAAERGWLFRCEPVS